MSHSVPLASITNSTNMLQDQPRRQNKMKEIGETLTIPTVLSLYWKRLKSHSFAHACLYVLTSRGNLIDYFSENILVSVCTGLLNRNWTWFLDQGKRSLRVKREEYSRGTCINRSRDFLGNAILLTKSHCIKTCITNDWTNLKRLTETLRIFVINFSGSTVGC